MTRRYELNGSTELLVGVVNGRFIVQGRKFSECFQMDDPGEIMAGVDGETSIYSWQEEHSRMVLGAGVFPDHYKNVTAPRRVWEYLAEDIRTGIVTIDDVPDELVRCDPSTTELLFRPRRVAS